MAKNSTRARTTSSPRCLLAGGGQRAPGAGDPRPRYDDWSWPRASRTTARNAAGDRRARSCEETGLRITLGSTWATPSKVRGNDKLVRYWAAGASHTVHGPEDDEVVRDAGPPRPRPRDAQQQGRPRAHRSGSPGSSPGPGCAPAP
ncbi:hypothetical protein QJS66_20065 [Kocuria rhizophila]|nr:hypothetical protein QJS66_20065 [Kocuria rhizophila]